MSACRIQRAASLGRLVTPANLPWAGVEGTGDLRNFPYSGAPRAARDYGLTLPDAGRWGVMASRRKAEPVLVVGLDGTVIVNIAGQKKPSKPGRLFVGMPLSAAESRRVLRRLDDAAHECQALVLAARSGKSGRTRTK